MKRFYWRGLDSITGEYLDPQGEGKWSDRFYTLDDAKRSVERHILRHQLTENVKFEIFDSSDDSDPVYVCVLSQEQEKEK